MRKKKLYCHRVNQFILKMEKQLLSRIYFICFIFQVVGTHYYLGHVKGKIKKTNKQREKPQKLEEGQRTVVFKTPHKNKYIHQEVSRFMAT